MSENGNRGGLWQLKTSTRVLNLDDNEAARYVKTRGLVQAGFEVIEAGTGEEALRIAREQRPDIALLDVKLPDMSGLEVCRRLKADPLTSDIPVVQISATHVTDGDVAAGFAHGADIYLTEPVEAIVLLTVVRTLLRLRSTESGLLVSEERFKAIVNQATAGIVQIDLEGRFLHVNGRYCQIVGRTAEDLYEMRSFDVVHFEDIYQVRKLFDRLVKEGVAFDIDERYVRPDGAVRWASNSVSLVRDKQGRAQHVIAVVVDITERKRVEERDRFLAGVSERLAELSDQASTLQKLTGAVVPAFADWCAVDLVDNDGNAQRVASSNVDHAQRELEHALSPACPAQDSGAEPVPCAAPAHPPELIANLSAPATDGAPPDDDRKAALRDFGLRSFISVPLLARERLVGTLAMGTSSSGRSYRASDLAVAADLGRRVSTAIENADLYFAIRQAARRKDEFLATLAHELRNPLAPLQNSVEIVRRIGTGDASVTQALGIMGRQVAQLRRLVDDLLDVSRIDTGKIELRRERISLSFVVNNALEAIRATLEASHQLTVLLPPHEIYLYVDPARISQVITNLFDNAAKFTPPGGQISLLADQQGDEIVITVKDTGIGIDPHMVDKIFDLFVQADNSIEKPYGGLGIGLTLVKRLAQMHGGSIKAASPGTGKGSSFVLRLPIDEAAANAPRPQMEASAPAGRRNIVVVDDNRDSAGSLGALLTLLGHDVHTAFNGPQALQALADYRPEIMFLDIGLPGMSGYEVARNIRKDELNNNVLVVALSGYGTTQDKRRSREAGFDMHITKPVDIDALNRILGDTRQS